MSQTKSYEVEFLSDFIGPTVVYTAYRGVNFSVPIHRYRMCHKVEFKVGLTVIP